MLTSTLAASTPRVSPRHRRYLSAGCRVTRTEVGNASLLDGHRSLIHFYGPCASCGGEMRDVTDEGFEDSRHNPYVGTYYGPASPSICTSCAGLHHCDRRELGTREAACAACGKLCPSSLDLAFFSYSEGAGPDSYYCGCAGWD